MSIARKHLRSFLLSATFLLMGPAAATGQSPSGDDEGRYGRAPRTGAGGFGQSEQAQRLEEALERYREIERRGGWNTVPTDVAIGPDQSYDCTRIAAVERRLIAEGYLDRGSTPPPLPPSAPQPGKRPLPVKPQSASVPARMGHGGPCKYTSALTEAVKEFQLDRKVLGYGQIGKLTMAQLNRPVEEIISILEHDLQRWQKVSLPSGGTYLLINIPYYELIAYEGGREALRMPVIVGQPTWKTPQFNDELEYIVVNPDWGIPESIAKLEYWPSARRDPKYLSRQGITTTGASLRQKPGPQNPLGKLKFVMPNSHDVYLHDTPAKKAFTAAVKALSHGCVRVGEPVNLANYLLRDDPQWDPRRLENAIATGKTMHINLAEHVPVYIVYSTSRVNDEGRLELRPDVYGFNNGFAREAAEGPRAEDLDSGP